MASNIPDMTCDTLKVNLALATGMNGFSGDAKSYGAFRAVNAVTQPRTVNALNPLECLNYSSKIGDKLGVKIVWEKENCAPIAEEADCDFTCDPGVFNEPTTEETDFIIDECVKLNLNIPFKDWEGTCCGIEEYYNRVLQARRGGNATQIKRALDDLLGAAGTVKDNYSIMRVAEMIQRKLSHPTTGVFAKINEYILQTLLAGKGYNYVTDAATGAPVGNAEWMLPVLYDQTPGCATSLKRIDPNALRTEIARFIRQHPNCQNGFTIIGGHKFQEMFDMRDIYCCNSDGINQAMAIQKNFGFFSNFYVDDTIDTVLGQDKFLILENDSVAWFWLAKFQDPARRLTEVRGINGIFRSQGVMNFGVSNCRDNGITMPFDSMVLANLADCLKEPTYNLQLRAEYGLWTRPAIGCDNPRTGIYLASLADIC